MRPLWVSALVLVLATGCGAHPGSKARTAAEGAVAADAQVSDAEFASAVNALVLSDPGSSERKARLKGTVARQMTRALDRFKAKHADRGIAAVTGAIYLTRTGELTPDVLGANGVAAVRAAVAELANSGDEGRAHALYAILLGAVPEKERAEVAAHIAAIGRWTSDAVPAGDVSVAGARAMQKYALRRHLLEPSKDSLAFATQETTKWIQRAMKLRATYRETRQAPPRTEADAAVRALQQGGAILVALHLFELDAAGAIQAVEKADAKELVPEEMMRTLASLKSKADAATWLDTLRILHPASVREGDDEDMPDARDLFHATAFRVGMEAYRLDPTLPDAAGLVAAGMQEFGMAEASPTVLKSAIAANPDPRAMSGALAVAMRGMGVEMDSEDPESARRVFRATVPIFELAASKAPKAKLDPSPARVRALMGEIELREGRLPEAKVLFAESSTSEPSGLVFLSLARIEWHTKELEKAKAHLQAALASPDTAKDPVLKGDILVTLSDVSRASGDVPAAKSPLVDALRTLAKARTQTAPDDAARVERMLSRVLDRFGASAAADKALDRAFVAASRDKSQVSQTVSQQITRAVVRTDLVRARDGLSRALAADLPNDELVYFALWVRLVERQAKVPTDGSAGRVFSAISDDGTWIGRLAAFGAGKLKADDLVASAKTPVQKTEALFYRAMDKRASGDAKAADEGFRAVLAASGLELSEMVLAREILEGAKGDFAGALPKDVVLP
ncbi:MAG: hypothetical protein U0169_09130 [Polyangiaceae bacterium]